MLELLQTGAVREAALLVALRQDLQGDVVNGEVAQSLVQQVRIDWRNFMSLTSASRLCKLFSHKRKVC